jgi:hypothetical protein
MLEAIENVWLDHDGSSIAPEAPAWTVTVVIAFIPRGAVPGCA